MLQRPDRSTIEPILTPDNGTPHWCFKVRTVSAAAAAETAMPAAARMYTCVVEASPNSAPAAPFKTVGEIICPAHMKQVKHAEAIAVATGVTAFETATIAVGMNIPCEKPHRTAPTDSIARFPGRVSHASPPTSSTGGRRYAVQSLP